MNKIDKPFDLFPHDHKDISPHDFLKMSNEEKMNIKSSKIIPPTIGSDNFGKIRIEFKIPLYDIKEQ